MAIAEHERLNEEDRRARRREKAELWRAAQRVSVSFDRLVSAQIIGMFVLLSTTAWFLVGVTESVQAITRFGISLLVLILYFPLSLAVVRIRQRACLRIEQNWALGDGFGMTGYMRAIGQTKHDKAGLVMRVELSRAVSKAEFADLKDTLASVRRKGTLEREEKTVTIHSGTMPTKEMIFWCRDVAARVLPRMAPIGIARVTVECEGGGFVTDD